jgi:hydroxymethylglutaryl-CoA lyase
VKKIDVLVSEVGPRDGLQSLKSVMPTEVKKAWIQAQFEAGTQEIEVGSFVSSKIFPQLADTPEIVAFSRGLKGLHVAVLVPNLMGLRNAVESGAHKISIPFSVSETHSHHNLRRSHQQMFDEIASCVDFLETLPRQERPDFEVGLSTAFGCALEGKVSAKKVIGIAEKVIELGVDEVCLSDTAGSGNPSQLKSLAEGIWQNCGREKLKSVHLHNTRGQGLANALMAVQIGISTIDSSIGGIGGCPFSPGASGNIVTEDLVFMLESMGLNTGIDIQELLVVRDMIKNALPQEKLYGFTSESGLPLGFCGASQ